MMHPPALTALLASLLLPLAPVALVAADPADSRYLVAQPASITEYPPVATEVDADYTVVPLALQARGEDPLKQLENLRKCRQAILDNFQKDHLYELSPIGRASLPGEPPPGSLSQSQEQLAGDPDRYLVVRIGASDPEKTEAEIRVRMVPLETDTCHIHVQAYHLALRDPERIRRDLLIAWEHYVELNRIALPKTSHARIDGLERSLNATATVDGRHVLVSLACELRVEEDN
jgi:hypothetical protein